LADIKNQNNCPIQEFFEFNFFVNVLISGLEQDLTVEINTLWQLSCLGKIKKNLVFSNL